MNGNDARHATHQDAQKSTYTTLPPSFAMLLCPCGSDNGQSGAARGAAAAAASDATRMDKAQPHRAAPRNIFFNLFPPVQSGCSGRGTSSRVRLNVQLTLRVGTPSLRTFKHWRGRFRVRLMSAM